MPSISLVVPAYNEEAGLRATIERCQKTLKASTDEYEIVILDDCSKDRTPDIMEEIRKEDPQHIRTYRHDVNQGIAVTFEDLYKFARKEYVFLIPGDGEYPPEALIQIMPMLTDFDVVICHRRTKNYTPYRQLVSSGYRWLTVFFFGVELYDPGSTKVVKREIFEQIPVTSKSVYVEAERIIRAAKRGYRIGKVEIVQESRRGGQPLGAKWSTVVAAVKDVLRLWWVLIVKGRFANRP